LHTTQQPLPPSEEMSREKTRIRKKMKSQTMKSKKKALRDLQMCEWILMDSFRATIEVHRRIAKISQSHSEATRLATIFCLVMKVNKRSLILANLKFIHSDGRQM
jgi:hypothetical protein